MMRSKVTTLTLSTLLSAVSSHPQFSLPGQDVRDIFLSGGTQGRFGEGGAYSADSSASIDPNSDILVEIVKGSATLTSDYNTNQVSQAQVESDRTFEDCSDYTEQLGYECVPYYQCSNGSIITDGAGLIDIRNGFAALNPEESKCPGFLDVCCKDPEFIPPPPKVRYTPQCGRRNNNGLGARIQGFKEGESQMGEWPHMCAILREENGVKTFQCGASLISPNVVLTAAHCVQKFRDSPGQLVVRCGEWDTQTDTEPFPHQDRFVDKLTVHPEFNARSLANDYAVLFTTVDFVLDYNVDTICLPRPGENFDGRRCFATGWGKDKFGASGQYQVVLKELEIPMVESRLCQEKFRATRLGKRFRLDPSFICAGGEPGQDTCQGDGGGPLVCPSTTRPDTYTQAGIVAWGVGCGGDTPGAYAAVSQAVCWMDRVVSCNTPVPPCTGSGPCPQGLGTQIQPGSALGYTKAECGDDLDRTLARLANYPSRVRAVLEQQYKSTPGGGCTVGYRDNIVINNNNNNNNNQNEELFDFSMFERVGNPGRR